MADIARLVVGNISLGIKAVRDRIANGFSKKSTAL
jgi:hypothetical protein